jgi:hypothetical protein
LAQSVTTPIFAAGEQHSFDDIKSRNLSFYAAKDAAAAIAARVPGLTSLILLVALPLKSGGL